MNEFLSKQYSIYFDGNENFYVATKRRNKLVYHCIAGLLIKVEDRTLHECEKTDTLATHIDLTDGRITGVRKKTPGILR